MSVCIYHPVVMYFLTSTSKYSCPDGHYSYLSTEPGSISPLHVLIRVANAVGVGGTVTRGRKLLNSREDREG